MDVWKTLCCFCANAQGVLSDFLHLPSLTVLKKVQMKDRKIIFFIRRSLFSSQGIFQYRLENEIILFPPRPNWEF